jgi:hypothetical protein
LPKLLRKNAEAMLTHLTNLQAMYVMDVNVVAAAAVPAQVVISTNHLSLLHLLLVVLLVCPRRLLVR